MNVQALVLTAFRSIPAAFKASAQFSRTLPGTYNSTTGTRTADATQAFTCDVALVPPKTERRDGVVQQTAFESLLIVPAASCTFEPNNGTKLTINNKTWKIVSREKLDPKGDTPFLYTFGVSR
jgi:hypothetical protein